MTGSNVAARALAGDDAAEARKHVEELLRGQRFEACADAARTLLRDYPDDWETLYLLAVACRYDSRPAEARAAIERLLDIKPEYGRAHQESGHLFKTQGKLTEAVEAYRLATLANPALLASWQSLLALSRRPKAAAFAVPAAEQVKWLTALGPVLQSVESFIHEGKLKRAEELCRQVLDKDPTNVEAMRQLASIAAKMNELADADYLLESAREFSPGNPRLAVDHVSVLLQRQKYAAALAVADRLAATEPHNPTFQTFVGNARLGMGDFDGAIAAYDAVLARYPHTPAVHLSRGHALKTMGRQADAIHAYRAAYHAKPGFGDAYWSLANLKTYRFTPEEIEDMLAATRSPRPAQEDRIHMSFALGKALEDEGRFAEAFERYEQGNALSLERSGYDPDRFDREVERMIAACDVAAFRNAAEEGCPSPDPIFIVGMPRAGSTLVEQILASHSQVEGTAELPNILATVQQLSARPDAHGRRYPENLPTLDPAALRAMGEDYIAQTATYRTGKPRFIDKMPNNFRHIGLIRRMLPNARIIDVRRNAMACCFSNFKQLFAAGQEFSYGLEAVGRYYRKYVDLMEHWDAVTPGFVLRVRYEDVLEDLEGQVRRILAFCDLPFEAQCLEFHRTSRPVRTASSEQVRQPLSDRGRDQWRHFAAYLKPLELSLAGLTPAHEPEAADIIPAAPTATSGKQGT